MEVAFTDFLEIFQNEIYIPLYNAFRNTQALFPLYTFITSILNGVLNTELVPVAFGPSVIASIITISISIYSLFFIINLIKKAFSFIINIFDDQLAIPEKRRRKRKWNFLN